MIVPKAEHGVVCSLGGDFFGYFGWPSVTRMDDGTLLAAASGLRNEHVCPYGRTVLFRSGDEGRSWSSPRVIHDSPLDDRDAGIVSLGGSRVLVTWFTVDIRSHWEHGFAGRDRDAVFAQWRTGCEWFRDDQIPRFVGSWVRTSDDAGATFSPPRKVAVTTPHGPIRLAGGRLLYLGKVFGETSADHRNSDRPVVAMASDDGGESWQTLGAVPLHAGTSAQCYHEPHVVELPDGKLVGLIRFQSHSGIDVTEQGLTDFSLMQTESADGGKTWTPARPLGFHGSPPHLLRHSSGALVCVYGCRLAPFGQRAAVSRDGGQTWTHDLALRDDGPDSDLGYPCSVELPDASIFTLYYQKPAPGQKCAVLWTRWRVPDKGEL